MSEPVDSRRLCPFCGALVEEAYCGKDGTPTVAAAPFSKHPRSYEAGDVIGGRYRVTGALGAGGFAAVYATVHILTEQPVAVKLLALDPSEPASRVTVRRFFREAQVTAALASPNTVRVFDVGQDQGGALYIAMELLRGESLEGLLKRRLKVDDPLAEGEAIDLALPLLESLSEAHGKGLVHRDLKPANIFLARGVDDEIIVKVLDFGIARTSDSSLTIGGAIPGTPPFMSPEQCRGEEVDGRSDLYAVAVILFLCTTGKLPFYHANVLKLMRMQAFDPAPDPRTMTARPLSEGFARVLLRCLAKQPAQRQTSAAQLRDELAAVAEGSWRADPWDGGTHGSDSGGGAAAQADGGSGEAVLAALSDQTLLSAPPQGLRRTSPAVAPAVATAEAPALMMPEAAAVAGVVPSTAVPAPATAASAAAPVATAAGSSSSAAAPTGAAPTVAGRGRWLALAAGVAIVGGGVAMSRAGRTPQVTVDAPATSPAASQAPTLATLDAALRAAASEQDPARRLAFAQEAVRLAPDDARARAALAAAEGGAKAAAAAAAAAATLAPTAATPSGAGIAAGPPQAASATTAAPAAVAGPRPAAPAVVEPKPTASRAPAAVRPRPQGIRPEFMD